jgi:hypothetical protein
VGKNKGQSEKRGITNINRRDTAPKNKILNNYLLLFVFPVRARDGSRVADHWLPGGRGLGEAI